MLRSRSITNWPTANAAEAAARAWHKSLDHSKQVGARHHIVPRFYLNRFSRAGTLLVRDRADGSSSLRNVRDLGMKDFYTFINTDDELDGSMEQLLAELEAEASVLFRQLFNPFTRPRPLSPDERTALDTFVAFQMVRGMRNRREIELIADYYAKLQTGHLLSQDDLTKIEIFPDQNEHIGMMGPMSKQVMEVLGDRPTMILTLDKPLLITCDEPVLVIKDDLPSSHHVPTCVDETDQPFPRDRQIVHVSTTRTRGLATAEEIVFPVDPKTAIVYGPRMAAEGTPLRHLTGQDAVDAAEDILASCLLNSLDWVAAHPDHPTFASVVFPPAEPLLEVCDGGSVMSREMRVAPSRRRPRRRR